MEVKLRQSLVWPNLKKDVEAALKNCHECQATRETGRNAYSLE
jgi:hypothetical protein